MPRRAHDRRHNPLQHLVTRLDALAGGPCRALHELAEAAPAGSRPFLLMAAPPGRCARCDAIRERQRQYDLAHPPPKLAATDVYVADEDEP